MSDTKFKLAKISSSAADVVASSTRGIKSRGSAIKLSDARASGIFDGFEESGISCHQRLWLAFQSVWRISAIGREVNERNFDGLEVELVNMVAKEENDHPAPESRLQKF